MDSPLDTVLANIFMCHFEEKWVLDYNARPSVWLRYVDDTFSLFDNKSTATQFLQYLNNCHTHIIFTVEFEENCMIPFLDIHIKRHNHTFATSIYWKKTFTGLYTKWDSFTPRKYKVNLIRTLTFRCFRICSSPSLLRSCLNELRKCCYRMVILLVLSITTLMMFWTDSRTDRGIRSSQFPNKKQS